MSSLFAKLVRTESPHEVSHLRDRVRLYLQVMLVIDVVAYLSDVVTPWFVAGLQPPSYPSDVAILRHAVTVGVACAWLLVRFTRPGRIALIAAESTVTITLPLVYARLATAHMAGDVASFAPVFTMFGIMLLLGIRAALVPSSVIRTSVLGLASVVGLFVVAREAIHSLDPLVIDGLVFIGAAYVLSTAITSQVIYGLRREVRRAMQLGQYTLEEKLGEGGMGAVYKARHAMLRRPAAIKLIKPNVTGDGAGRSQALQRFEREAHATASLKSPHTVELYDFGVSAEGEFYYVMELLDGIDLETLVTRFGPLPAPRVVYLLRQACESLAEAHASGLVHRDIKPANLFLCRHGLRHDFVKVLDFGLVALGPEPTDLDPKRTVEGTVGGTPAYLAPEVMSHAETVDERADVYALGCVAYWLLTGRPPFERSSALATVLAHVNDAPVPPSSVSEIAVPAPLEELVLACLAKRPGDRPASALELAHQLAAAVEVDGWDEEKAARWWRVHVPIASARRTIDDRDVAVKVTLDLRHRRGGAE